MEDFVDEHINIDFKKCPIDVLQEVCYCLDFNFMNKVNFVFSLFPFSQYLPFWL